MMLTPITGAIFGRYILPSVPAGTFDLAIKSSKSLRVLVPDLTIGDVNSLPDVTLIPGDANGDNRIDPADFGLLVNAYGSNAAVSGSGYDPQADFNYDGVVDIADFGLLVNEYGSAGAL